MKKLLFAVATLLILCTVCAGCGTADKPPENTEDTTVETAEPPGSTTEPEPEGVGSGDMGPDAKYNFGFYGIADRFAKLVDQEAYQEWLEQCGYFRGESNIDEFNILGFIKHFNISKEDLKAANLIIGEEYVVFSDKEIEALYSDDPVFLARMFKDPDAFLVNGEIYTRQWIMDHSLEEITAAGITGEVLRIRCDENFYLGSTAETSYNKKLKSMLEMLDVDAKYDVGFYGIDPNFVGIPGREAYEEWLYQNGYYEGKVNLDEVNLLKFIQYFDISKERFTVAAVSPPYRLGDGHYFTTEKIDALYSDDKNLLAETFMAPEAINVNGEIYTPYWIASHSIEEIKAAGITEEMLQSKYDEWIDTERFQETDETCIKTKALLEAFN